MGIRGFTADYYYDYTLSLIHIFKVYENGNISVKFKFADELRKIAEYIEINTTEDTAVAG